MRSLKGDADADEETHLEGISLDLYSEVTEAIWEENNTWRDIGSMMLDLGRILKQERLCQ